MSQPEPIDRAALANLLAMVDGDTDFLNEMIDTFFDDAPRQLATISAALAVDNASEVRRAAHALKSNAANFGARALAELCRQLEEQARQGDLGQAPELLGRIGAVYEQARLALEAERPG